MSKISVRNLTKKYGTAIALNNVSLEIESGEFFGVTGPVRLRQDNLAALSGGA